MPKYQNYEEDNKNISSEELPANLLLLIPKNETPVNKPIVDGIVPNKSNGNT